MWTSSRQGGGGGGGSYDSSYPHPPPRLRACAKTSSKMILRVTAEKGEFPANTKTIVKHLYNVGLTLYKCYTNVLCLLGQHNIDPADVHCPI